MAGGLKIVRRRPKNIIGTVRNPMPGTTSPWPQTHGEPSLKKTRIHATKKTASKIIAKIAYHSHLWLPAGMTWGVFSAGGLDSISDIVRPQKFSKDSLGVRVKLVNLDRFFGEGDLLGLTLK